MTSDKNEGISNKTISGRCLRQLLTKCYCNLLKNQFKLCTESAMITNELINKDIKS